jgi:predicted O-methyltransferase YrrM
MTKVRDRTNDLNRGAFACRELAELLHNRRIAGKRGRIFGDISTVSTVNNLRMIRKLLWEYRPERTLEVGFCLGGSALLFCSTHKELGHPPQSQHTTIDPYQTTTWDSCGLMAVERAGLMGYLDFRAGFSALELPKLFEGGARFGLVYIDGSHVFEDVFVDSYFVTRLLIEGGLVLFDDSSNAHVRKVIRFLRTNLRLALTELDLSLFRNRSERIPYRVARYFEKVQLTAFRRVGNVERNWNAPFHAF